MSSNSAPAPRSRQEVLDAMTDFHTFLIFTVAKEIERLSSKVQSSGSSDYVNAATNKLGEAKEHIGSAIRALGEARGSLKDEQERSQGR